MGTGAAADAVPGADPVHPPPGHGDGKERGPGRAELRASLAGVFWARSRPLDVSDEAALAASDRATFFLGIAFAESAALFGFVGMFLVGRLVPYLIGLAVSLLGFAMIAPTRSNIERRQGEVTARGSTFSLGHAVMTAPPTRPPDR